MRRTRMIFNVRSLWTFSSNFPSNKTTTCYLNSITVRPLAPNVITVLTNAQGERVNHVNSPRTFDSIVIEQYYTNEYTRLAIFINFKVTAFKFYLLGWLKLIVGVSLERMKNDPCYLIGRRLSTFTKLSRPSLHSIDSTGKINFL